MHGLARALQDLNRLDEAIAVSNRIVELDPDDVLAHTSLSVLYQKKGMIPEAEAEGNKARVLGWKQQLKKGQSRYQATGCLALAKTLQKDGSDFFEHATTNLNVPELSLGHRSTPGIDRQSGFRLPAASS